MEATVSTRVLIVDNDTNLIALVHIECSECGEYTIMLPGHHVTMVLQALQVITEKYPEMTDPGEVAIAVAPPAPGVH